jgi:pimeloyl-ACP methyl ester carboxylesterase
MTMADDDRLGTPQAGGHSRWIDLDGPVHYIDYGGPLDAPVMVCVHGLGGSAVNWAAVAPLLTGRYRMFAPDLAGHGLTQSAGRGTDVAANRVLLHRFIKAVSASPVILMGNSMGGMISLLEAIAAPSAVACLILLDPALPFVAVRPDPFVTAMFACYVTPGLGRVIRGRRSRMSPESLVAGVFSLCCVDPSRVPADVVGMHVAMARERAGFTDVDRDFTAAARSVVATAGHVRSAPYRRGIRSVKVPVLLVHGARDRLVPVAAARAAARANPSWTLVVLLNVGHVPQLEAARETARAITGWLGSLDRRAESAAG